MIEQLILPPHGDLQTTLVIGALAVSADAGDSPLGEARFLEENEAVRIPRTPHTMNYTLPGVRVTWRGERWRIARRAETDGRTEYDLLLERAS